MTEEQRGELHFQALGALVRTEAVDGVVAYNEYVLKNKVQAHHRVMLEFLWDCIVDRKNGLGLLPRGAAKTTHGTIGFGSWLVSNYPDIAIGLMSNTQTQADAFSRAIRNTIDFNPQHVRLFGSLKNDVGAKWTDAEWMRKDSALLGTNNSTMFARGVGGAIISKRFDVIILDDIIDPENADIEQLEKVGEWLLLTVIPCLKPDGVVIGLGTRWSPDDIYGELIKAREDGGKGWRNLLVPALTTTVPGKSFAEVDKDQLVSYWPEYWPVDRLVERWQDLGTPLFLCAYQNDVSGLSAGDVFPSKFEYFTELDPDKRYTIRMGVDLASSEKERADFTARVTTAEDEDGNFYVLSVYRDKRSSHHAEFVHDGWLAYPQMDLVLCENQQFQSTLIQEVMEDYPRIPIEGIQADKDKTTRARAVAAKYEGHKVKHHVSLKDSDFERELRSFTPKGTGHDDMVDALGYSMDMGGDEFVFASVRRR